MVLKFLKFQRKRKMADKDAAVKTALFDRIFKPETITLSNGHTVNRPRSRMWLISGVLLGMLCAILMYVIWPPIQP